MAKGFKSFLKKLFSRNAEPEAGKTDDVPPGFIKDEETGLMVETDDPMMAEIIATAFKSDKPVIGNRDESGKVTIKKLDL